MTEPQATERHRDPADVVEIKARNQQELARIANEHELELARLDAQAMRKMPLPLRMIFDDRLRTKIEQAAKDMSEARGFTPPHLLGKTAACKVVIVKAIGWNLDHYAVAAATYETPGGKVGFEGSLYRAIAAESGLIVGEFEYEWYGEWDRIPRPSFKMAKNENGKMVPTPLWEYWGAAEKGLGIRVTATIAATGKERSIDFDLIDAHPRNATTWPTRPRLQIINPATRAFVTLVKPELLMGVHFRDAVPDDAPEMRDVTPAAAPEPQAQNKLSVIAARNAPPPQTQNISAGTIPQTAPGRGMPLGTNQRAPQVQAASEPVSSSPEPSEAASEPHRRHRRTSEQITHDMIARIYAATSSEQIEDELALSEYGRRSVPEKALIDTAAERRKRELQESQFSATAERPPEPAGEARSQEPAATPAPGREDVGAPDWPSTIGEPGWVTEETEPAPALYVLVDTRGDLVSREGLSAIDFMAKLTEILDFPGTPEGERRAWKARNRAEIQRLADTEGGALANDALDLLS